MSVSFQIDHEELRPLINQAIDAAIHRMASERPTDQAGKILIDKRQAAEALDVSVATIDRWRKEAGLPAVIIDSKVLFRPESLKAWAEAREEAS